MEDNSVILPDINRSLGGLSTIQSGRDKYRDALSEADRVKSMLNARMDKLNNEGNALRRNGSPMRFSQQPRVNPNSYSYQFIDPIYHPLEMPINAEPVTLPKIEMGMPISKKSNKDKSNCNHKSDYNLIDIIALLTKNNAPQYMPPQYNPYMARGIPVTPRRDKKRNTDSRYSTKSDKMTQVPTPNKMIKDDKVDNKPIEKSKRAYDWWKVARAFTNMYEFLSVSNKYGKHSNIRDPTIEEITRAAYGHIDSVSSWMVSIQDTFFDEFKVYPDLDLSFTSTDNRFNLKRCSEIVVAVLTKFMTNLYGKSGRSSDVPDNIQMIIYQYIREKGYFPRKYLSQNEINRLDFDFYGGMKNVSDQQAAFVLTYFIISRCLVQKILLSPKQSLPQLSKFINIEASCRIIGSILHYLVRGAFATTPTNVKDLLGLLNYFRNYHLFKEQIEEQNDLNNNFDIDDTDELCKNIMSETSLNEFWKINGNWCNWFKQKLNAWSVNLGKIVKSKYARADKNLEKKKIRKPQTLIGN